jgi:hypothetical protein
MLVKENLVFPPYEAKRVSIASKEILTSSLIGLSVCGWGCRRLVRIDSCEAQLRHVKCGPVARISRSQIFYYHTDLAPPCLHLAVYLWCCDEWI